MAEPWKPGDHTPQDQQDSRTIPTGTYLVGATWIDHKPGRKWVKFRCEVLHGPMKGASCFPIMPINVREKQGSANKVYHFLVSMSREDVSIDFDSAVSVANAFLDGGFKARIEAKKNGKYINHDLTKFATLAQLSDEEKEVIREWNEERAQSAAMRGSGDDADFVDFNDDAGGGGGFDDFPADDFGDDEIPF